MNRQTVGVLFVHEMRMLLRDRRTVMLSVLLPLVVMPLMLFAGRMINQRREKRLEETTYRYAVTGTHSQQARSLIELGRESITRIRKEDDEGGVYGFKFEEIRTANPGTSLQAKDIHFYIEALTGEEADRLPRKPEQEPSKKPPGQQGYRPANAEPVRLRGVPLLRVYYQGNWDPSQSGSSRMREMLRRVREEKRDALFAENGFPVDSRTVLEVKTEDVASAGQVAGSWIGRLLTVFLLMFMLSGGAVVAMDIVAGEKERGSLETLLTTAAARAEIVAAKQLAIVTVAVVITVIQVANVLAYVTFRLIELPADFVIEAPPLAIATMFVLFLPVAALVSAVLLMISAYAKSYKEAQLYFFPVYLVGLLPALASVLPGISLRSAIVAVPVANVSVAVREIMVGKFDWPMIALSFAFTLAAAVLALRASTRMLSQERLITSSESDAADIEGGPALFPKHVLRWYAVLATILFAVAVNVPQLATFRRQLLFNELLLFVGAPLLMIWKYRLNPREALAIRPVRPLVWLAVLLIIPAGHMVGLGVFRLADLVFPVPREVLEQFSKELLPEDVPGWQLYLFVSVLPGICEEIGFRGTLLYGLRRRFRPAALVLAVGLIFGLFHIALFRILPTAFMGIVLTSIALLTGSIFPCMVVHAGNNALALYAGKAELPLGTLPWWAYGAATMVFALAFLLFYVARSPYPGIRRMRG
jgi:sodium transport system permease protein